MPDYGLGRRPAPDPQDHGFLLSATQPEAAVSTRSYRYWYTNGWWGNQGNYPHCVAFSFLHLLEDGPVTQTRYPAPLIDTTWLYKTAQTLDEWPGENYDGTSVRAGAKVLEGLGIIESYHWAFDEPTIRYQVLEKGPVGMSTDWYTGFFSPSSSGRIEPTGSNEGGHAWVINGYSQRTEMYRAKNSWGRDWGLSGFFYLHRSLVAQLIADQGEACVYVEKPGWQRQIESIVPLIT